MFFSDDIIYLKNTSKEPNFYCAMNYTQAETMYSQVTGVWDNSEVFSLGP